jgi:hypothetical protein
MGSLVLTGDTSGSVTVAVPAVAGTNTATFPAATGTVMVSGNMPAFSAYGNASQTVTNNTFTKVTFQAEDFDTNSNFDSTTNYRFTPTVAGYYQINAELYLAGTVSTIQTVLALYKNGSIYQRLIDLSPSASLSANGNTTISGSILVYMNGSTDYLEIYGYYFGGTSTFSSTNAAITSRFNGSLVRGA